MSRMSKDEWNSLREKCKACPCTHCRDLFRESVDVFNAPAVVLALRYAKENPEIVYRDYPDVLEVVRGGYFIPDFSLDHTLAPSHGLRCPSDCRS